MIELAPVWQRINRGGRALHERWLRKRLPLSRSLVLTESRVFILPSRYGVAFLLMLLALFFAGINYANSLILGSCFLLISLFMVSILHTYYNLSGLEISAGHAEPAFAGGEAAFEVVLRRRGERSYESIRVQWAGSESQVLDLIDSQELRARLLLPVVHRGRFRPGRLKVDTTYPLGLVRAWSWIALEMETLVYPKPLPCPQAPLQELGGSDGVRHRCEGSDDFDGLRSYQAGDSPRQIAWKTYARGGGLHTKQFHGYRDPGGWLDWDGLQGDMENRLSQLCYWVLKLSAEGERFGLRLPTRSVELGQGAVHERLCLEALAHYGHPQQGQKVVRPELNPQVGGAVAGTVRAVPVNPIGENAQPAANGEVRR